MNHKTSGDADNHLHSYGAATENSPKTSSNFNGLLRVRVGRATRKRNDAPDKPHRTAHVV